MKFLLYKLYRYAKAQEDTVDANFGFLGIVSVFEILHLLIIFCFIEDVIGYKLQVTGFALKYSGWIFVAVGFSFNYFIFIKTGLISRINEHYQKKNYSVWKGNVLFFLYIVFLFILLFIQTWYYKSRIIN
jgi:hypothetical protein